MISFRGRPPGGGIPLSQPLNHDWDDVRTRQLEPIGADAAVHAEAMLGNLSSVPLGEADVFDYAGIGVDDGGARLIVDPDNLCFHCANRAGSELLQRQYPVRLHRGLLKVVPDHAASLLRDAIKRARQTSTPAVLVADGDGGPFSIRAALWPPPAQTRILGSAVAILDVRAGSLVFSSAEIEAIAVGFQLTDAEAAVMNLLAGGLTLAQIAHSRGVAVHTVRHQCKAIFAKTHCHRQVDLIRLVVALCTARTSAGEASST